MEGGCVKMRLQLSQGMASTDRTTIKKENNGRGKRENSKEAGRPKR